jgi:poly(beta-D-mannuronate) lyase
MPESWNLLRNPVRVSALVSAFMLGCIGSAHATLRSPWESYTVRATHVPYACPAIVPLSPNLTTNGFYSDGKGSIVDPAKMAAYARTSGPHKKLGQEIVDAADFWRSTGSRQAAVCAMRHMEAAAREGVLTGRMSSRQAYYVQGWVIGAIAISWLKLQGSGVEKPESRKLVLPWLVQAVGQTQEFYASRHAKNNHLYWAGVEVAAAGIADNNRKLLDWGISAYRTGIDQIQPDGSLPLEMRRGRRALHYHLYALSPLVYLADFGAVNGLDLFAERDHALARLERLCVQGLYNNQFFVKATGIPQDTPYGAPAAEQISWGAIWEERFPDPRLAALLRQATSLSYMYLGGLPPGMHHVAFIRKELAWPAH